MQLAIDKIVEFFSFSIFNNEGIFTVWVVPLLLNVKNELKAVSKKEECVLGHIFDEIFGIPC